MTLQTPKKPFYETTIFRVLVFFILMFFIAEMTGIRENLNPSYIKSLFEQNLILSVFIYALLFILGNFLHVPGGVFLIGIILALGKFQGGVITYFVAVLSCMVSYFVIGYFAKGSLNKVDNKIINKFIGQIDVHPIRTVFILRFIMQSGPILNYTLATTKVSSRNYFIGTVLGLPIPIVGYCFFFDRFIQVFS